MLQFSKVLFEFWNGHRRKRFGAYGLYAPVFVIGVLCHSLATASFAASLSIGGSGAGLGTIRILANSFAMSHPDISIEIPTGLGSGGSIRAVIAGVLDIGLGERPLDDKERAAGARQIPYAKTPLVIACRGAGLSAGPAAIPYASVGRVSACFGIDDVAGLAGTRLIEIFSGAQSFWDDGTPVRIILRPETSTDTAALSRTFAGMGAALAKARAIRGIPVARTTHIALDRAEALPGALTTATLAAILSEHRSLHPIAIDGVAPTLKNLADGSYPLFKTLYLVIGSDAPPIVLDFVRFVQSNLGTAILRETGNLPIGAER